MIFGRTKPISARKTKNISFLRGANYERVMANIALINRYGHERGVDRTGGGELVEAAANVRPAEGELYVTTLGEDAVAAVALGARWNAGQCPRETRSISARTIRSTNPGRLSSSHDFSRGWSVSRTNSSSVCEFCFLTACASALNAESTAAVVCRDKSPTSSAGSEPFFFRRRVRSL